MVLDGKSFFYVFLQVCKLDSLLSVLDCSLVQHWYCFRVTNTSLSGMDPLSELALRAINSKCALVIYHFMLQQ
jgi:hypothetical protein